MFLSSKIVFDTVGSAILYCWNIILSATWTCKCTSFVVAALFNYIKEMVLLTQNLRIPRSDHASMKDCRFIYSCIHFRQLSGNSYQLLESECIWKLSVDAISFEKLSKHFPAQNHTGGTWKIYSILLPQGRIIPNPKQKLIKGLSRGFCVKQSKIWTIYVQ